MGLQSLLGFLKINWKILANSYSNSYSTTILLAYIKIASNYNDSFKVEVRAINRARRVSFEFDLKFSKHHFNGS